MSKLGVSSLKEQQVILSTELSAPAEHFWFNTLSDAVCLSMCSFFPVVCVCIILEVPQKKAIFWEI